MPEAAPPPADAEDPGFAALRMQEHEALAARRRIALGDGADPTAPRIGLAISGGGIRSATFGLGLLRGLARGRVLERLDYLSTVSGGGFVGAMFGRMVAVLGIADAQAMLAHSASPALDWLRRNGRYLTPAGARDASFAFVTYLRAILAIHVEAMLLCLHPAGPRSWWLPHLVLQGTQGFRGAGRPGAWPALADAVVAGLALGVLDCSPRRA
jgi:hypothetical protein